MSILRNRYVITSYIWSIFELFFALKYLPVSVSYWKPKMMDCKKEREIAKSRCVEYHKMYNVNIFWKLRQNTWSFTYFKWCLLLLLQLLAIVFRLAFFKGWLTWLMHDIRSISKQQCRRTWFLVGNSRLGPWFVNQVVSNSWLGFIMRTAHTHFYVLCQSDTSTF